MTGSPCFRCAKISAERPQRSIFWDLNMQVQVLSEKQPNEYVK